MDATVLRRIDDAGWDRDALRARVERLGSGNGLRMILVDVPAGPQPVSARLEVRFHNTNHVKDIADTLTAHPDRAATVFPITGGSRVRAGSAAGSVHVTSVAPGPDPMSLELAVRPVGDYTTYELHVAWTGIDPLLASIPFRFRPGCFSGACDPAAVEADPAPPTPAIDYLARDFDSFKHLLITALMERVPGWRPTSEADLDETLIELFSARADELADFQDRVMGEATIASARGRVSVARHARLMDYHLGQGSQASTWLALTVGTSISDRTIGAGVEASTVPSADVAGDWDIPPTELVERACQRFRTTTPGYLDVLLNEIRVHTWSGVVRTLGKGATETDLRFDGATEADAERLCRRIRAGRIPTLVIEETRDPATCRRAGFDRDRRQLLTLRPETATTLFDPLHDPPGAAAGSGSWLVHVAWREPLAAAYCIASECPDGTSGLLDDVSVLRGNLLRAVHGRPVSAWFVPPDTVLDPFSATAASTYRYQAPAGVADPRAAVDGAGDAWPTGPDVPAGAGGGRPFGLALELPSGAGPLLYRSTPADSDSAPCSTLTVEVTAPGSSVPEVWRECISLIHSRPDDPHFVVETDEHGRSVVRFGTGTNGRGVPEGATVRCDYLVGDPLEGNVGADSVTVVRTDRPALAGASVRNPLDVRDGRAPEPLAEAVRRAPEAFRVRQLRAVTTADYARRAEEVDGVAHAAARRAWTGSWRTVQVTIDPVGREDLDDDLRRRVAAHLDAVRLIGEDIEIRPPLFVPLDIEVVVCVDADHWVSDLRSELRDAFGAGLDRAGVPAFFHPDRWTFGQELHASQVTARVDRIPGVHHVESVRMRRFDAPTPAADAIAAVRPNEIIRVRSDPDRREDGTITFRLTGGRA